MDRPHQDQKRRATLKGRFLSLPTLVSFGLALAFLFFLVTRFDIDLSETWESFKSSNHGLFILALFIHYTTFVFRGARWSILLKNAGTSAPGSEQQAPIGGEPVGPSTPLCARLLLLGWFTNSVTWFRLGDAYRAYLYSGETRSSFSHTMGTIFAERVLDTLLVFILLVVSALFLVRGGVGTSWMFVALSALLLFMLAVVLVLMGLFRWRLAKHLPRALEGAFRRFHQGTVRSFRRLPMATFLGLLGWSSEIIRLFLVAEALGFSLSIPLVILVTLGAAMLTLVPITPGGLGVVEGGTTGLLLLSDAVDTKTAAFSIIILDRSISWLSIIVVGAVVLLWSEVSRGRRATSDKQTVSENK